MSSYYNQGVQVIIGNGQNFPGTPRISLIPFIQNAYDKGLLNFTVLPPGSISLAEIQDISTAKILGRSTAGSGVIEQISIGTGLSLSGGILSSTATATPGGSDTQIQYNNAGAFAGSANLVTTTSNMLDIQGSGSTSATNALRVRNSAGTNLLTVRNDGSTAIGSTPNGDPLYINESVAAGNKVFLRLTSAGTDIIKLGAHINYGHGLISTTYRLNIDGGTDGVNVLGKLNVGSTITPSAGFTVSTNTTASSPSILLSGTGFSGGTSTTTKPTFLIEPTGTTSNGWSTSGTKLGVNAESGFTGNFLDLQVNGSQKTFIRNDGYMSLSSLSTTGSSYIKGILYLGNSIWTFGYADVGSSEIFSGWEADSYSIRVNSGSRYIRLNKDNGLQFDGTTSSYPALKRNGTGLDVRLADDSGYGLFNTGKTTIYGSGATSATTSLLVQNSSSTDLLKVRDDGVVKIGSFTEGFTTGYGLVLNNYIKTTGINFRTPTVADDIIYGFLSSGSNINVTVGSITTAIFEGVGANDKDVFKVTSGFNPSSTTFDKNHININGSIQTSGTYAGKVRGLYVAMSIVSATAGTIPIAIETTLGDNILNTTSGSTAIGTGTINTNAKLQVDSTSKGFLPPRMTTAQRNAVSWVSGDGGMIIFNTTTRKHQGWDGSVWNDLY